MPDKTLPVAQTFDVMVNGAPQRVLVLGSNPLPLGQVAKAKSGGLAHLVEEPWRRNKVLTKAVDDADTLTPPKSGKADRVDVDVVDTSAYRRLEDVIGRRADISQLAPIGRLSARGFDSARTQDAGLTARESLPTRTETGDADTTARDTTTRGEDGSANDPTRASTETPDEEEGTSPPIVRRDDHSRQRRAAQQGGAARTPLDGIERTPFEDIRTPPPDDPVRLIPEDLDRLTLDEFRPPPDFSRIPLPPPLQPPYITTRPPPWPPDRDSEDARKRGKGQLFPELVAWRQGKFYKVADLDTGRVYTRKTPPPGVPADGDPFETYRVLSRDDDPPSTWTTRWASSTSSQPAKD